MTKRSVKFLSLILSLICMLVLLTSCSDPDITYFANDKNYMRFVGKITGFGKEDNGNYEYIWFKLYSENVSLDFNVDFQIVQSSYNELLKTDFNMDASEGEYIFVVSKETKNLVFRKGSNIRRYCIIGIYVLNDFTYLDSDLGKENLLEFVRYGQYDKQ